MTESTKDKVCRAVRDCLARCYGASNPLVQAADFVTDLSRDPQWQGAEVAEVEAMVLRAVTVIVQRPRDPCCHQQGPSKVSTDIA